MKKAAKTIGGVILIIVTLLLILNCYTRFIISHDPVAAQVRHYANQTWNNYGLVVGVAVVVAWIVIVILSRRAH